MKKKGWNFGKSFWVANGVELFERAAYYGTFIALVLYLTNVVGYTDIEAGWIGGLFSALIYFLPLFTGAIADKIGFRKSLILAFLLLFIGYFGLGFYPSKISVLVFLIFIALGGSFVKPVITGTVAKSSSEELRSRAYSLFYMTVNIGSFAGKSIAKPLRVSLGVDSIPFYSSILAFIALLLVIFFYFPKKEEKEGKKLTEILNGMIIAIKNIRFLSLIVITGAFWSIQQQLYATLPKYVIRLLGEKASPEWYANVNPLTVVLFVVPITSFGKRFSSVTSISFSFLILTFSSLIMSFSSFFKSNINFFDVSIHPITFMMVIGIALQGIAECFLSPRYLEFASFQAKRGEEGLYMGYAHLNTTLASILAFASSGYLLDKYCPDPKKFSNLSPENFAEIYANAHYIWYYYSLLAFVSFILLLFLNKTLFNKK